MMWESEDGAPLTVVVVAVVVRGERGDDTPSLQGDIFLLDEVGASNKAATLRSLKLLK